MSDELGRGKSANLEHADTVLADSGEGSGSARTAVNRSDIEASAFDLATGEPDLIPVSLASDAPPATGGERYESGPLLGAGGMGEVRLSHDQRIGRHVAVKQLHAGMGTKDTARRFLREARIQGQLEHPAVVPVYDLDFDEQDRPFFTMKRVRGQTLSKIIDLLSKGDADTQDRFGRRRLLNAFTQVCQAVHYAHVRSVVHRDLKPGNIMLGDFGEVYVLDWGVARLLRDGDAEPEQRLPVSLEASTGLTRHGDLVGSIGYMSPEQMEGDPTKVDARSDVFALGVVLFELLTFKKFREQGSLPEVVKRVVEGEKRRPIDVDPDVPPELDQLVARATARKPADRFQTAGELAHALERYLEGDRDREARKTQALAHTRAARKKLEASGSDAEARLDAMRDVVRALALDPENPDAQALLVSGLVDVKGAPPKEAEIEFNQHVDRIRARGAKLAAVGFVLMLLTFPLAMWAGVLSWTAIAALSIVTSIAAGFSFIASRSGAKVWQAYVLALLCAAQVTTTSILAGPFVLVPSLAVISAMYFVVHVSPSERRVAVTLIALGALAPYALEALGILPKGYSIEPDRIVLYARAVRYPPVPTLVGLIYTSLTFVTLPSLFAGWMHDELMTVQRRIVLQSWQLRRLFPLATTRS